MCLLKRTVVILVCCGWFASSLPAQEKFTNSLDSLLWKLQCQPQRVGEAVGEVGQANQ
jgi:hypothetical protein